MAFNSSKVEQMIRQKGIKAREYFAFVYPDRSGNASFPDIINNTNPKAESIERIADLLHVSIDFLFDREQPGNGNNINGNKNSVGSVHINSDPETLMSTINHLRDIIERQDKTIEEQNKRIDQLIDLAKWGKSGT